MAGPRGRLPKSIVSGRTPADACSATYTPTELLHRGHLHIEYLYMDLLKGTLDMLVLKTLRLGPMHGYGIAKAIRTSSSDALEIEFGSLYPSLKRLELKGWVAAKWETSEHNRKAKYYRLTPVGKKQLQQEHSKWTGFVAAVSRVMEPAS